MPTSIMISFNKRNTFYYILIFIKCFGFTNAGNAQVQSPCFTKLFIQNGIDNRILVRSINLEAVHSQRNSHR